MSEQPSTAWFKLYFGDVPVSFTVNVNEPLTAAAIDNVKASVALALAAGLTVAAPGMQPGEKTEEIGYVVRKAKPEDGTPFINFYPAADNLVRRKVGYYLELNKPEMVTEFESATGLKLANLPVYPGKDHLEKDGSAVTKQYMIPLPRPITVVYKDNPKYDPDAAKKDGKPSKEPKYNFVRYASQPATGGNNEFAATFPRNVNSVTAKLDGSGKVYYEFGNKIVTRQSEVITAAGLPLPESGKSVTFPALYKIAAYTETDGFIRVEKLEKAS